MTSILATPEQFKENARLLNNRELELKKEDLEKNLKNSNDDYIVSWHKNCIKAIDEILANREKGIEKEPFLLSNFKYSINWNSEDKKDYNAIKTVIEGHYDIDFQNWKLKAVHFYMIGDATSTLKTEKELNDESILSWVRTLDLEKLKNFEFDHDKLKTNSYVEFECNNSFKIEYTLQNEPDEMHVLRKIFGLDDVINSLLEQAKTVSDN